jgi:hypothetical protein
LELDLSDDKAWIGITPFKITGLHLVSLPPIPGLDSFNEINVRAYVQHAGKPGVWFFSLDASKLIPVLATRLFYQVPSYNAEIDFHGGGTGFSVEMARTTNPDVGFKARWKTGTRLREPDAYSSAGVSPQSGSRAKTAKASRLQRALRANGAAGAGRWHTRNWRNGSSSDSRMFASFSLALHRRRWRLPGWRLA